MVFAAYALNATSDTLTLAQLVGAAPAILASMHSAHCTGYVEHDDAHGHHGRRDAQGDFLALLTGAVDVDGANMTWSLDDLTEVVGEIERSTTAVIPMPCSNPTALLGACRFVRCNVCLLLAFCPRGAPHARCSECQCDRRRRQPALGGRCPRRLVRRAGAH